ncbi:hypothetical protein HDU96_010394, partial [Phlyctochytrium bullatum]
APPSSKLPATQPQQHIASPPPLAPPSVTQQTDTNRSKAVPILIRPAPSPAAMHAAAASGALKSTPQSALSTGPVRSAGGSSRKANAGRASRGAGSVTASAPYSASLGAAPSGMVPIARAVSSTTPSGGAGGARSAGGTSARGAAASSTSRKAASRRQRRTTKELHAACIQCHRDYGIILLHGDAKDLELEDDSPAVAALFGQSINFSPGTTPDGGAARRFAPRYICNSCCFANGDPTSAGAGVALQRPGDPNPYPDPKTLPKGAVVPVVVGVEEGKPTPLAAAAVVPPTSTQAPAAFGGGSGSTGDGTGTTASFISTSLSKKRNRGETNDDGPDCEVACSACQRVLGRGGCRIDYRPSSNSPPPTGIVVSDAAAAVAGTEDPWGRVSNPARWQLPSSIMAEPVCPSCYVKYSFCTACGAGGQYRIGKWRPREMFLDGRKCCNLSHVRVQNAGREGMGVERWDLNASIAAPLFFETRCVEDMEVEAITRMLKQEEGAMVMAAEAGTPARQQFEGVLKSIVDEIKQERLDSLLTDCAVPQVMERAKGYGKSYKSIVEFQLSSTTLWECLSAPSSPGIRRYVRVLYYSHGAAAAALSARPSAAPREKAPAAAAGPVSVMQQMASRLDPDAALGKKTIVAYVIAQWDIRNKMLLLETMYDRRATRTGRYEMAFFDRANARFRQYECRISSDTLVGLLEHIRRECARLPPISVPLDPSNPASPPTSISVEPPVHVWLWALRHRHDTVGQALKGNPSTPQYDETATDSTDFSLRRLGFRPLTEHLELCTKGYKPTGARAALPPVPGERSQFVDRDCHFVRGYERKVFMVYAADARQISTSSTQNNR